MTRSRPLAPRSSCRPPAPSASRSVTNFDVIASTTSGMRFEGTDPMARPYEPAFSRQRSFLCRYLYAFKESGCIYQPVYLGTRDDIPAEECTTTQLKYKAESEARVA